MPTELPTPKPINPGTEKEPENPGDAAIEEHLKGEPQSDIPSPLPDLVPELIPGVPTVR
ncbi:hypothetical protein [Oharaeibacter diazotrophicus]|uniref:Uncharacterized protein n=1 Tax=Oharaeibacter diazotrophicus TaxID=1920512 RepID=A0A4R6RIM5_9HYPH|nr:hypothetical protein [Oharaeibacter diazotrophicus]TDP86232.1 hypothetical protein EDD54_0100 [Oharaeibacter diazotrophicus]BBE71826.1 hypothetical protein OHA_1_01411 [Pleomorphomonas sp. SM30]GLS78591.1 hypothetical protein GCM10007904_39280 [Oharaeibacter diazotrophicus]